MRRLIINADDFGLTPGVNRAIFEAHSQGVVTSATLMANSSAFRDAVSIARTTPRLGVGCHVVLVDGTPLLPPSEVPSLLKNATGDFYNQISRFAFRSLSGDFDSRQLESEIAAQVRKIQAAGLPVSHLDTHKHTHIFPQVLAALLRAAHSCGVRALRNPFELMTLRQFSARPSAWKRWLAVRSLHIFASVFRRTVRNAGILTPDGTVGIVATGELDPAFFQLLVEQLPPGTWELVCHPGYNDADLDKIRTRLRASRVSELKLLISPESRRILEQNGIELISYRDLTAS